LVELALGRGLFPFMHFPTIVFTGHKFSGEMGEFTEQIMTAVHSLFVPLRLI
jgi:hypothetical protein